MVIHIVNTNKQEITMVVGSTLSRREFLKLLGAGAMVGILGKFANFGPQNTQFQPISREASAQSLGQWSIGANTSIPPIHAAVLRNGKILYLSGSGYNSGNQFGPFKAALFDPGTNSESIYVMPDDLFCCGFSQLGNGNILIVGGTKDYDTGTDGKWHGTNVAYEFDVDSSSFLKVQSMAHGRWYPSMSILPSGKVFVMTGYDEYGTLNGLTEIYDPTLKTFSIEYDPSSSLVYCVGSGSTLPGAGSPCYGGTNHGVNPSSTTVYSRTIVMPSGLVFRGGQKQSLYMWDPITGKWTSAGNMIALGRKYGTAVLLPLENTTSERGRVLLVGGQPTSGGNPVKTAEIADFNAGTNLTPVIKSVPSMNYARMYVLPVMLPTGKVVIFGGTSDMNTTFVFYPEMFDPVNNTWTALPPASVGRQYHSVAMLLPDGRVWTASGTPSMSKFEPRIELFSPWYFFAGPRPTISGPPTVGPYGGTITIPTADASSISSVSLVKIPNTTHHYDFELRLVWLQIQSTTSSSVTVSSPVNANLAPPGYYLIHVLNSSGVPSAGQIIQLPGLSGPPPSPTVPSDPLSLQATAGDAQVYLSWAAPSSNGGSSITSYKIYRSASSGTETFLAATGNVLSYTDTAVTNDQTYFYKVTAVNSVGESSQSNEASAIPSTPPPPPGPNSFNYTTSDNVSIKDSLTERLRKHHKFS